MKPRIIWKSRKDETGAALVLALVFVLAIGLILVAIVTLAGGALLNTNNLRSQRSVEFAADGATNAAVQWVRNSCPPGSTTNCAGMYTGGTPSCLPSNVSSVTINGSPVSVFCSGYALPGARTVQFFTCRNGVAAGSCNNSGSNVGNLLLQANVTYYDLNPENADTCTASLPPGNSCGIAMTINNWDVTTADN